jgi:putative ABC transport system ATP-binding protein
MATLSTESLGRTHRRGGVPVGALSDVSLTVAAGSFVVVTGPSGSGKSTLLQLLGLLDRPTAGRVLLDGADVGALPDDQQAELRRRRFGFVFQSFHLLPGLTAWENVAVPRLLEGERLGAVRGRASELLDAVGLGDRLDDRPSTLSGGEQQRVAIARSLVAEPAIVLADEPTGALDQSTSREIVELLVSLTIDVGRSLIMVTHDPLIAAHSRATRVALRDGTLDSALDSALAPITQGT